MLFHKEQKYNKQRSRLFEWRDLIPGHANTISKFPTRFPIGNHPIFISKAKDNYIFDMDDNQFLDWTSGLGTNILGYTSKAVNKAIREQLEYGINYSYSSELEHVLSKKLAYMIPSAESVRIFKTGSDACNAAIRVARAFTKRNKILVSKDCYHGNGEWFANAMDYHNGVPSCYGNYLDYFEYNNISSVKTFLSLKEHAAVILEPAIWKEPDVDFLKELKEQCELTGTLLIFDEMVTGLRSPMYSIQAYTKVTPDLSTFGKSLGNGMPISVLVGRSDVMQLFDVDNASVPVFYSGTYNGEVLSIAASIAVLDEIRKLGSIHPTQIGQYLREQAYKDNTEGDMSRIRLKYKNNLYKSVFMQELSKKEIVCGNIIYPNYCHTDKDAERTALAIVEVTKELDQCNNNKLRYMLKGTEVQDFNLRKA